MEMAMYGMSGRCECILGVHGVDTFEMGRKKRADIDRQERS